MPTITIKNGNRTLKLTKREREQIEAARFICDDLCDNYDKLQETTATASTLLEEILEHVETANGKPADAGAAGK